MRITPRLSRRLPIHSGVLGVLVCLPLAAGSALAASAPQAGLGSLLACRSITAGAVRLQCFDRTSAALARAESVVRAAASPAEAAPPAQAAKAASSSAATAAVPEPSRPADLDPHLTFGLSSAQIVAREVRSGARRESLSSITAQVTGLGAAADGRVIYNLDNGQTWRELLADGEAPPVKSGDRVKVSRGWLDSYWLQTASGRGCKVERLH